MRLIETLHATIHRLFPNHHCVFDPSPSTDHIAEQVDWEPMASSSTNFRSHAVHKPSLQRLEIRPKLISWILCGTLLLIGAGAIMNLVSRIYQHGFSIQPVLSGIVLGIIFGGGGLLSMRFLTVWYVFDSSTGMWSKEFPVLFKFQEKSPKWTGAISEVHAIQLIGELSSNHKRSTFERGEINLVLHDGSRRFLVQYGNPAILDDAKRLADFLSAPLWSEYGAISTSVPEDGKPS